MKFFVIIGKDNLYVYSKEGEKYVPQYIDGNSYYPYEINDVEASVHNFLDELANEKNLETIAKLEFEVLENENKIHTDAVLKVMGEYVYVHHKISDTIKGVLKKLSKDKKLLTTEYGINYDGICYKIEEQKLVMKPFDLLGYTVHGDDILEFM